MRRELGIDHSIAAIAERQGGVIGRQQIEALGLSASAIQRRVRSGRLHRLYRGVYAVGHRAVGVMGRRWAAVLAVGEGAIVSHASAGAAYDLRPNRSAMIHVTVPATGRARRAGVKLHWRPEMPRDEVTTLDGLPITTPARTLLDLAAGGLRNRPLEAAVDAAERRRLLDFADLHELLARYPGRPGTPSLKAVLARYQPGDTRSELEEIVVDYATRMVYRGPLRTASLRGRFATSIGRTPGSWWRPIRTRSTARHRRSTTTASAM